MDDALAMVERGEIDDGKTVILLQWAAMQRAGSGPLTAGCVRLTAMPGPLEGVKVVELGVWIAGPAAGGVLADWGADVVKIEPPEGDPSRGFGKMLGDDLPYNPVFELDNRGKRSVVLDLVDRRRQGRRARPHRRRRRVRHQRPPRRPAPASASTTSRCWPATRG